MALPAWALLTVEEAREAVRVEGASEDVLLESLVTATTLRCENYTGRKLLSRTYTDEIHNGTGGSVLKLREYPVTSVSALELFIGSTWVVQSLVTYPPVIVQPGSWSILFRDLLLPWGYQNVKLTYVAGLTVAEDMKAAARFVLLDLWKVRDKLLTGVASQSFQGQTVTYLNEDMPKLAARLLDPYRRLL